MGMLSRGKKKRRKFRKRAIKKYCVPLKATDPETGRKVNTPEYAACVKFVRKKTRKKKGFKGFALKMGDFRQGLLGKLPGFKQMEKIIPKQLKPDYFIGQFGMPGFKRHRGLRRGTTFNDKAIRKGVRRRWGGARGRTLHYGGPVSYVRNQGTGVIDTTSAPYLRTQFRAEDSVRRGVKMAGSRYRRKHGMGVGLNGISQRTPWSGRPANKYGQTFAPASLNGTNGIAQVSKRKKRGIWKRLFGRGAQQKMTRGAPVTNTGQKKTPRGIRGFFRRRVFGFFR